MKELHPLVPKLSLPRREAVARMAAQTSRGVASGSVSPSVRNGLVADGIATERRYANGLFLELTSLGGEVARAMEAEGAQ